MVSRGSLGLGGRTTLRAVVSKRLDVALLQHEVGRLVLVWLGGLSLFDNKLRLQSITM